MTSSTTKYNHLFRFQLLIAVIMAASMWNTKLLAQEIIEVGGILQEDTFWSSENIYVVTEDVIAGIGIALEIGPGTEVRFNQGRGIMIEGGSLLIDGAIADSVWLIPNQAPGEDWNWKGISISSVSQPGSVIIKFAIVKRAIVGIKSNAGNYLSLSNNSILENRNVGISLINSSYCILENNNIADNFLGLEIFSTDPANQSSHNQVMNNRFANPTTNLLIHNSNQGGLMNNEISENLIEDGTHGIWLFKSGLLGAANVSVTRNIIINNGTAGDGYGIYVSMDSAYITNNIFWKNTTAISFRTADHCVLANNSIYQNKQGVELRSTATGILQLNNTIAANLQEAVVFNAHQRMVYEGNNMFFDGANEHVFVNNTSFNISIPDNFWGTTNYDLIDDFILDKNDDPSLGLLIFDPILSAPDTTAPVSPPRSVTAQQIGNEIRLEWQQNPESDLLGYRVYYGDFSDYSFSQSSAIIEDTVFFLDNSYAIENIAITALDKYAATEKPQLSGNESPFAFATPMPYAGEDTTVCKNELFFQVTESTIPYAYDSVRWHTAGDGTFEDGSIIRPVYFPGSADLENGSVKLVLNVFTAEAQKSDSLRLFFADPPIAFAGDDGLISPDSLFTPNESFALNYDELNWETTGDGTFSDIGSLATIYTPGLEDIENESVKLILSATGNYCGSVFDTLLLTIKRQFSVEGRIWAGDTWLAQNPVMAINLDAPGEGNNGWLRFTNSAGIFRFEGLFEGNYLFFAPADTAKPKSFFPAYHPNKMLWQDAFVHHLNGDTYDLDIRLREKETLIPEGEGKISGRFQLPENMTPFLQSFCRPWFGSATNDFCQGGLSNITIYLFGASEKRIYDYTITNGQGEFLFAGLPFGRYLLKAEMAGYESLASEIIELSPDNLHVSDLEIAIRPRQKVGVFIPHNPYFRGMDFEVYPNPASHELYIAGEHLFNLENPEISIYNSTGICVFSGTVVLNDFLLKIDIANLPGGVYFGTVNGKGFIKRFTFIKSTN